MSVCERVPKQKTSWVSGLHGLNKHSPQITHKTQKAEAKLEYYFKWNASLYEKLHFYYEV